MNDAPTFLRNDLPASPERRWLKLALRMPGKNPEGIGGVIAVSTEGGPTQTFPVFRCQSFLGTDDPRIPVGVGSATKAKVVVTWPGKDRKTTTFDALDSNAGYYLKPDGSTEPMPLPRPK
jgi:hypothetical protein